MMRAKRGRRACRRRRAGRPGRRRRARGVQERVDDGSVVAGHNPAVRPPAQESRLVLHVRTARRVVAEDHRGARGYRPLLS